MQTVNIVVTDFAGRDRSTLIESINEIYAEPPYHQESIGSFAKIRIAQDTSDEVQLCFSLVPPSIDAHPEAETIWESTNEGALAFVLGIPGHESQAYTRSAAYPAIACLSGLAAGDCHL